MNKKRAVRWAAIIGVVIILAIPIVLKLDLFSKDNGAGNAPMQQGGGATPVEVAVLSLVSLDEKVETAGTILPNEEVGITSESSGKIVGIYFDEGTAVNKGQLLVKINDAELRAQLERIKYQKKLAEDREYRQKQLLEKGAVSQQEYERALTEANTLGAEINLILAQIAKTEIRAPFSGIIGLRYVSEGSYIAPNTRIADLIDYQPVKIDFSIPEKYAGQVKPGDKIRFTIEKTKETYIGNIAAIEPRIDPETRTLKVRAEHPNDERQIVPGSFAKVEVILSTVDSTLLVPAESVIQEMSGQKVFVVSHGKVEPRQVETGMRYNKQLQIISGLAAGDSVISAGILKVRPGAAVQVTKVHKMDEVL